MALWNEVLRGQKSAYNSDEDETEVEEELLEDSDFGEDIHADEADLETLGEESEFIVCAECGAYVENGYRCDECGLPLEFKGVY